jgi:hypothetical protein
MASASVALGTAVSVLAATSAAGTAATPSPPQTVKSKDGGLVVTVPRGALRKPTRIRIRVLTRSQYPPELRQVTFKPGSKLYALEPAGLRFLKPVRVTRRIDAKAQGFDLREAAPGIVLTTRSADGGWEILDRQSVTANGDTLVVSATTRHFSTVVAFDGGVRLKMVPGSLESVVGATWDARVVADIDNSRRSDPTSLEDVDWLEPSGNVKQVAGLGTYGAKFTCTAPGRGYWIADAVVGVDSLAIRLASVDIFADEPPFTERFRLYGVVDCKAKPPTPAELALACVVVAHTPLGSSPSFLRWLLSFRGAVPPGARAELTVSGMNGGQPVSGAIDGATGRVELLGGITSYGGKQVQKLTVGGQDVTPQLVAKTGSSVNVTAAQGTAAGQCP